MEEQEQKGISLDEELKKQVNEQIGCIVKEEKISPNNVDYLGKLVDINKDLQNIEYQKVKEEKYMRYRDYEDGYGNYSDGSYGRRSRDSRGRYTDSYGRRGYDTKYRANDMLDEMSYSYGAYSESNEYGDSYGASAKELEKMLDCNIALIEHLKRNAKSQEEMQIIDKKLKEMSML